MERLFVVTRKWTSLAALIALMALTAQRPGLAHGAAQADPLKFTAARPVIIGWQVKVDKTKDFEDFWAGLRAVLAKSESADLKTFGDSLNRIYKVDAPPFADASGSQVVLYFVQLDPPSTAVSYNPSLLIYTDPNGLRAALENPKMPRKDADDLFDKVKSSAAISAIWPLTKVGG